MTPKKDETKQPNETRDLEPEKDPTAGSPGASVPITGVPDPNVPITGVPLDSAKSGDQN